MQGGLQESKCLKINGAQRQGPIDGDGPGD